MKMYSCIFLLFSRFAFCAVDPIEFQALVYGVYMSTSPLCTSPIEVLNNPTPQHKDIYGTFHLGSLDNSNGQYNGTYPCMIIKMSELVNFRPKVTTGNCQLLQFYSENFCTSGFTNTLLDGTTEDCSSATGETVFIYLSTLSANSEMGSGVNPFSPPTQDVLTNGLKLSAPFSINGKTAGRFVINPSNRVTSQSSGCSVQIPTFSFVNE